jgi:hypothetical protein
MMLSHVLGIPLAVGGAQVAVRANLAAQTGQQKLVTGIQPLSPELDAPARGRSWWDRRREFGLPDQVVCHAVQFNVMNSPGHTNVQRGIADRTEGRQFLGSSKSLCSPLASFMTRPSRLMIC